MADDGEGPPRSDGGLQLGGAFADEDRIGRAVGDVGDAEALVAKKDTGVGVGLRAVLADGGVVAQGVAAPQIVDVRIVARPGIATRRGRVGPFLGATAVGAAGCWLLGLPASGQSRAFFYTFPLALPFIYMEVWGFIGPGLTPR